jgi:Flp pilus assembly protein TadG
VEFALTSLLLLLTVFGTIDLGRAVFTRTMLANAVREAARQGAVTPGSTATMAAAAARSPTLGLTTASFTVSCSTWATTPAARACDPTLPSTNNPPPVQPLDKITVCTDYPFGLAAARLLGRATITFHECEQASVQ